MDDHIAAIEGRLMAIEAILHNLPKVVTQEVLETASHDLATRSPFHPMGRDDVTMADARQASDDALAELWRQMRDK